MITVGDYAITSLETVEGFELGNNNWLFTLDELQNATIAQTEDKQDITGKQGRKLTSLKRNKAVTISGTNGLVSGGLLSLQTGSKFKANNEETIMFTDYLTVTDNKASLSFAPGGGTGNEVISVHILDSNGVATTKLTIGTDAKVGETFTYKKNTSTGENPVTTHDINFAGIENGTEIVVRYLRKVSGASLDNYSDRYSGKCTLYVNVMAEDKCGNIYHGQFYIPKADFNGEFSLEMGDNQTVHNFEAEALAGSCGNGGMLWKFVVFGANAA